jgi:4-amino-4-deoxy-L-arabinose transferase-like glycosyltransferase
MNKLIQNHNDLIFKIAFWAVVLLALATRLYHLDAESLFMDEWCQVSYYNDKFHEIIYLAASQTQPPLDYWIGHVIYYYAQSDFAVRLPAAMFGTGSVAILMLLVARISGWHFAIPAGAVMALLPFHLYFSQEARPYAIAIFFLLLLLWMLAKMLETAELKKRHYIALLFIACGLLFSRTAAGDSD